MIVVGTSKITIKSKARSKVKRAREVTTMCVTR